MDQSSEHSAKHSAEAAEQHFVAEDAEQHSAKTN